MPNPLQIVCRSCHGDGYHVTVGAPGRFDVTEGCFFPAESLERCRSCDGEGVVPACPRCRRSFELDPEFGHERCDCESARWRDAA